jgi:hypothetical protein
MHFLNVSQKNSLKHIVAINASEFNENRFEHTHIMSNQVLWVDGDKQGANEQGIFVIQDPINLRLAYPT